MALLVLPVNRGFEPLLALVLLLLVLLLLVLLVLLLPALLLLALLPAFAAVFAYCQKACSG